AKLIGFAGLSGPSRTVLSGIKKYGLIEDTNSGLRVSDLAVGILVDPKGSEERKLALQKAAFSPALFAEFWTQFGSQKVSDEILKATLIKRGFMKHAAETSVSNYRETVQFLEEEAGSVQTSEEVSNPSLSANANKQPTHEPQRPADNNVELTAGKDVLVYRISADCSVRLIFDGPVTVKRIEKLIAMLDLNKDAFPVEE
ncbi:MAG: hypothetical protein AABZ31_14360, partial [Bdellovibrionota bacterium]